MSKLDKHFPLSMIMDDRLKCVHCLWTRMVSAFDLSHGRCPWIKQQGLKFPICTHSASPTWTISGWLMTACPWMLQPVRRTGTPTRCNLNTSGSTRSKFWFWTLFCGTFGNSGTYGFMFFFCGRVKVGGGGDNNRLLRDESIESCLTEQRSFIDIPCVTYFCFV